MFSHRLTSFNGSLFRHRHLCLDNEQHHKHGTAEDCLYLNGKNKNLFLQKTDDSLESSFEYSNAISSTDAQTSAQSLALKAWQLSQGVTKV